jgi:hypothetical protein
MFREDGKLNPDQDGHMNRFSNVLQLLYATLAISLVNAPGARAQSISGTVKEATTQSAVSDAVILLLGADKHLKTAVRSTSDGKYVIAAPAPGEYYLSLQKTGLTTINTELIKVGTAPIERNFDVTISPPTLSPVTVTGKSIVNVAGPNKHKYDLFLLRRNLGIGTFLTREQIESKPASQTYQLFQNIPGLKISQHGTEWFIRSQRCPPKLPVNDGPAPSMDDDTPDFPILFIDGFRVKGLSSLRELSPTDIEGIEVYQGAAQLPAEAKGNACAAIFVWLKER